MGMHKSSGTTSQYNAQGEKLVQKQQETQLFHVLGAPGLQGLVAQRKGK